jgi:exopolysaccharide biosynthesis WecB/TagA/CpsF family protein
MTDRDPAMPLPPRTRILGIGVSRVTYETVVEQVAAAARSRRPLAVTALAVHGLMSGVLDPDFARVLHGLDILTPDGQPVRWALNLFGRPVLRRRVYGPTLMLRLCERAAADKLGVYLFGSRPDVVETLARKLARRFPGLEIAGLQADRFREATAEEDRADVERILASGARLVFCGRGCPRQERWCLAHRERLSMPLIAVGAAFDFHAGMLRQAPAWMQNAGLEWLFRLAVEPRRLWRRYLLLNPLYLACLGAQALGWPRFARPAAPPSPEDTAT